MSYKPNEDYDEDGVQRRAILDEKGREILDPIGVAPPVGYEKPFDMFAHMQNLIRSEHVRLAAMEAGAETFDEADDFDIEDDPADPTSQFEEQFDPVGEEVRQRLRNADYRAKVQAQLDALTPKENDDGDSRSSDERREGVTRGMRRDSTERSKDRNDKDQKSQVRSRVRDRDKRVDRSTRESESGELDD